MGGSLPGFTPKDLLSILFKRKSAVIGFCLATVITGTLGALLLVVDQYQASAELVLEPTRAGGIVPKSSEFGTRPGGFSLEQQVALAQRILGSTSLLTEVANALGPLNLFPQLEFLYNEEEMAGISGGVPGGGPDLTDTEIAELPLSVVAGRLLQERLYTQRVGTSPILNISFRHEDPVIAADVVNKVVELFLDRLLALQQNPQRDRFFQEQFELMATKLADAESTLAAFREQNEILATPGEEITILLKTRAELVESLATARNTEAELNERLELLRSRATREVASGVTTASPLQRRLAELMEQERDLASRYKDTHPDLIRVRRDLDLTRSRLQELGESLEAADEVPVDFTSEQNLAELILESEAALSEVRARIRAKSAQLIEQDRQLQDLDDKQAEFGMLEQEVTIARDNYRLWQSKYEEFRINRELDAKKIDNVTVLEEARVPLTPLPSQRRAIVALAVFFGLAGGIGLAFVLEMLGGTLNGREEVEHHLGKPVLGSVPEISTN